MPKTLAVTIGATAVLLAGCLTRHELVVEPNEAMCEMYGVTQEDISRAVERGPRDVKELGLAIVKVLPDGTVIRLRHVARVRYRERKGP